MYSIYNIYIHTGCFKKIRLALRFFPSSLMILHGSFKKVNDLFRVKFGTGSTSCKSVVQAWLNHFRTYGTVLNLNA